MKNLSVQLSLPKILIVDDKEENLFAVGQVLESVDADLIKVNSGNEGLFQVMKHEFALILLDVQMPGINGFETAEILRGNKKTQRVPIVFLTAFDKEDTNIFKGYHAGAVDYLIKPINPDILLSKVKVFLELYNQKQQLKLRKKDLELEVQERTLFLHETNKKLLEEMEERKQAQTESMRAKEEAEKANKAKTVFLDRMSHELRTPLNSIIGFTQVMQSSKTKLSEIDKENLGFIYSGGKRLEELINKLLDYSKIETGKLETSIQRVDLASMVENSLFSFKTFAGSKNVDIQYSKIENENYFVEADPQRLMQIIENIISNAIKFNKPNGSIVVSLENQKDEFFRIGVRDTGTGILDKNKDLLFNSFERLDVDRDAIEGVGIGLVFSKKLVEMMGGDIGFESVYGEGSYFFIDLPKSRV